MSRAFARACSRGSAKVSRRKMSFLACRNARAARAARSAGVRLELINGNPGQPTPTIQFKYAQYESRRTLMGLETTNQFNANIKPQRTTVLTPQNTAQVIAAASMPTATDIRLVRQS